MSSAASFSPGSLPHTRTGLIGRERERAAAWAFLLDEAVPLLTLTGPGGVGKTRLALAIAQDVADRFADGVAWVDLATLADPALVPARTAAAVHVTPSPDQPIAAELARQLRHRQTLLLFDNCEHVLAATADLVAALLTACPALQVATTSRAPLHVRGEQILPVDPLPLPAVDAPLATVGETDAVRLFTARARAVRPGFAVAAADAATVALLCRQLDGLPLAIELAAAHSAVLSPAALFAQMTDRFRLLTSGARDLPRRQQTMHNTIAWSYDRLTLEEQGVFRHLTVFAGGWTLEAAAVVLERETGETLGLLEDLVAQSLVVGPLAAHGRPDRFTMLETIREFGMEHLAEAGETHEARRRHAAFFSQFVSDLDAFWAPFMPNAQQILDQLETEHPNLNAALAWQRDAGETDLLVLAGKLYFFWQLRGRIGEGQAWLEWGLGHLDGAPPSAQAIAQIALAGILFQRAEFERALRLCDASVALFAAADDAAGVVHACECAIAPAYSSRQLNRASSYIDEAAAALARVGDRPWTARLDSHLHFLRSAIAFLTGQFASAEQLLIESVEAQRAFELESNSAFPYACWPLHWLGRAHAVMGRPSLALERHQAALDLARRAHEQACIVASLGCIGRILAADGRWQEAALLFGATEAACHQAGYRFWEDFWPWEQAHGLPEPWQRSGEPYGHAEQLRVAVEAHGRKALPPIPDPATADEIWSASRTLTLADAIDLALTASLSAPVPPLRAEATSASSFPHAPRASAPALDHDLT